MQSDLLPVCTWSIYPTFPKLSILEIKGSQHSTAHTQITLPFTLDFIEPPGIILGKMIAVLEINWYRIKNNGGKMTMYIHSEFKIKLFLLSPVYGPSLGYSKEF